MNQAAQQWNYHERINRGEGVISKWLRTSKIDKKGQARFERALDQLQKLPKTSWHKPNPASNIGDHTYVIRFTDASRAQHRVFGHFFDSHAAFVMTFNGNERDNVYYPTDYQLLAQQYRSACDAGFFSQTCPFSERCTICKKET
jgi:hypothetical protein